jgi:hypothetical protein
MPPPRPDFWLMLPIIATFARLRPIQPHACRRRIDL